MPTTEQHSTSTCGRDSPSSRQIGDFYATNHSTYGTGILTGLTDPNLDFSFVLAGNFPVGTPFDVVIKLSSVSTVYGNGGSTPIPGHVLTNAIGSSACGLVLEEAGGQVMTLPAGYALNSASWGVTDNHFATTLAVESESEPGALRLSVGPNPSSGEKSARESLTTLLGRHLERDPREVPVVLGVGGDELTARDHALGAPCHPYFLGHEARDRAPRPDGDVERSGRIVGQELEPEPAGEAMERRVLGLARVREIEPGDLGHRG